MKTKVLSNGIQAMNTGRKYDKHGQIILWYTVADSDHSGQVAFFDISRGIHGYLDLPETASAPEILSGYDSMVYESCVHVPHLERLQDQSDLAISLLSNDMVERLLAERRHNAKLVLRLKEKARKIEAELRDMGLGHEVDKINDMLDR